jgi:tryptophan synthase alpha chain
MSNRIDAKLTEMRESGRKGIMTHVVIGYPSLDMTEKLVVAMEQAGVDFVELQIPFSDPLADGPTIQKACEQALAQGARVRDAFVIAHKLASKVSIPLLFMAYFNTVYKYGVKQFCKDAAEAGIAGLIIPDAPMEAAKHEGLLQSCKNYNLHNIITLAPTSTCSRLEKNRLIASGFVYCMSRQGVTGAQQGLAPDAQKYLENVRRHIDIPIAVGFGISNHQRLAAISPYSDIAVVGSAILDLIDNSNEKDVIDTVKKFISGLKPEI